MHRIGRTGRAGRSGEAILFVAPRERNMLRTIERATRQPIEPMELPSVETVNEQRVSKFKQQIVGALADPQLDLYRQIIEQMERDQNTPAIEIAAALARLLQGDTPLLLPPDPPSRGKAERFDRPERPERSQRGERFERSDRFERDSNERPPRAPREFAEGERAPRRPAAGSEAGMETFRVEVGHVHGAKPGNLVGAIANEAGLESRHIGRIDIRGDHSLIDLPVGMPDELMQHLKQVWVAGQRLKIARASAADKAASSNERPAPRPRAPGGARFERGDSKPGGFKGKPGGGFKGRPRG